MSFASQRTAILTNAGKFLYASAAFRTLLQRTAEELNDASIFEFLSSKDVDLLASLLTTTSQSSAQLLEGFPIQILCKSGWQNFKVDVEYMDHGPATDSVLLTFMDFPTATDLKSDYDFKNTLVINKVNADVESADNLEQNTSTELKRTLAKLNIVLDSSLDLICTTNYDGEFVSVNAASERILGYTPSELIGTKFIDLVSPEDIEFTANAVTKILSGTKVVDFENRYVHKNGNTISLLWSVNWDKNLGLAFCIAKDITEKKRLEKAFEIERNQFYDVFLKAPTSIGIVKGADHVFEMVNPLYLELIGKKDIIGKKVADVLPEVIDQGFISVLDHVYTSGEPYADSEVFVKVDSNNDGVLSDVYINFIFHPHRNSDGHIIGIFFFINDITEQVLSRKLIEKSEKQYRQIVETAQEGIWLIDENAKTTFVNKKMCEILEYSEDEIMGKQHFLFMADDEKHKILDALERRKLGIAEKLELTFISKSGRNIVTQVSANPIFDEIGNFKGSLGMLSDITEKKHLQDLLEKTNRLARIGSWEIDVENGTVFWSDITREIREADADFVPDLSTGISYFAEGASKEMITQRVQQCRDFGIPWDEELQFTTFKGNLRWVRTIGEAAFNNGICTKIYGSFQDITEKKNAVERILRSEAKLNAAQHIAQVGSWELDLITNQHTWSEEFHRILGIHYDVEPSIEAFISNVHKDDVDRLMIDFENAFADMEDSSLTFRFVKSNGEIGYASSEWQFEYDTHGKAIYIHGILRDLTKEKKAETERLNMINDIVQRNKDLEQFSYIISHNLRSPVANIIGLTEELRDDSHDAETKEILQQAISSDVKRLEEVIADLNTILQTKREITERTETVNLLDLVQNIKLSINDLIQNQDVHIVTEMMQISEINTIKSYIQSIFYNLISNSIKYRKPDNLLLINIASFVDQNNKLQIIFKDNGIGIDLDRNSEHIFGLYKRFHRGTEGKGMGLYMVKTQVETLGGKISVKSEVNAGTEFMIEFDYE